MFSRIIPNWEQINNFKQPLTEGERNSLTFLDKYLPIDKNFDEKNDLTNYNGWLIFAQPYLNGNRPDIVIFHPFVGLQIIEVKDWDLDNYRWWDTKYNEWYEDEVNDTRLTNEEKNKSKIELHVQDLKGHYPVKNPLSQVDFYKDIILSQLVSGIGEYVDSDNKGFGLIKTSVFFQYEKIENAIIFFKKGNQKFLLHSIFGYDSLNESNISSIIPDSKLQSSKYWKREWNEEILFWLNPPFHSIEQGITITLSANQKKFSEPTPGHHRVRGVAGSGKTHVLAYRAAHLASLGYKVMILSFNITLWHYIRDMIQRSPFDFHWQQIKLSHYHGFCGEILNRFGKKWPLGFGENFFIAEIPAFVLETIRNKDYEKYDAVLIDEGQDYCFEWYEMLSEFLSERDECVIVIDKRQNVYKRELSWLDKRKTGREKFSEWIELKTIYRLPPRIAEITNKFSEEFKLNQEVKFDRIEQRETLFEHLVWQNIENIDWLIKIESAYNRLKIEKQHPSDIVILLPDKYYGFDCVDFFENMNVGVNHVFEDPEEEKYHKHKKAFWMGGGKLKMSTIHSFKGWELKNIIMFIPAQTKWEPYVMDAMIYTAMTRSRENLIVFNANERYKKFGENLSHNWGDFKK